MVVYPYLSFQSKLNSHDPTGAVQQEHKVSGQLSQQNLEC